MRTREALLPDAEQIHELIATYSHDGTLLPRTFAEVCENVRDFVVLKITATLSAAARSIFTARTWPRFVPSPSIPRARAREAASGW